MWRETVAVSVFMVVGRGSEGWGVARVVVGKGFEEVCSGASRVWRTRFRGLGHLGRGGLVARTVLGCSGGFFDRSGSGIGEVVAVPGGSYTVPNSPGREETHG